MARPRRVLLCGLGSIGRRHLRLLREADPALELAALRSGLGAGGPEEALLAASFAGIGEALAWQPEAAIVASPAPFHCEQACQLAAAGISLLIEKPLGTGREPAEAWRPLRDAAARRQTILVGYVLRHDPAVPVLKSWLAAGRIGTPVTVNACCGSWLPDWRPGSDYRKGVSARFDLGGGVLLELSHELDLLQALLGPLSVEAAHLSCSGLLEIDVEDLANLTLCSAAGVSVSLQLDFCTRPPTRSLRIRGSEGDILWDLMQGRLSLHDGAETVSVERFPHQAQERYRRQLDHFLACCRGEAEPLVSLEDGLAVLELVRQARSVSR
jgi:predicted dehydrogenase